MLSEPQTGARVLVVDDDATLRVMLTRLLDHAGYSAAAAADVDRALARLADDGADLVLTDIVMPGRSGLVLLAELREELPGLPVIAMSASDDEALLEAATILGARAVLRKPFRAHVLFRAVDEALSRGGAQDVQQLGATAEGRR